MVNSKDHIALSKLWIEKFVLSLRLCPFGGRSFYSDLIAYEFVDSEEIPEALVMSYSIVQDLVKKTATDVSNSFLIFRDSVSIDWIRDFDNVLNAFLEEMLWDEYIQTVVFHKDFVFDGHDYDHYGNFVNRAPLPMIHLLRRREVKEAMDSLDDIESVPTRNKELLESLKMESVDEVFQENWDQRIEVYKHNE